MTPFGRRIRRLVARREDGTITPLVAGLLVILLMVALAAVDLTSVQLARLDLLNAADAAAADAADELDDRAMYEGGLDETVPIITAEVGAVARESLARQVRPDRVSSWSVTGAGVTPQGAAVVTVQGTAVLPVSGPLLRAVGGSVTLEAESRARAVVGQ